MTPKQKEVVDALKFELSFLGHGGYERSVRTPEQELSVFQDSPTCLNDGLPVKAHPCSECLLIDFVPADKRGEAVPCHSIPLNDKGETVADLEGYGRDADVQDAVRHWLRNMIAALEAEKAA